MEREKLAKWAVPAGLAVVLFLLCAFLKGLFAAEDAKTAVGLIADCFTLPGAVLGGFGLLTWIASFGQFDLLSYGTKQFFGHFIPSLSKDLPPHFYEYRKEKEDKGRAWLKETTAVGGICMGLALLCVLLYAIL